MVNRSLRSALRQATRKAHERLEGLLALDRSDAGYRERYVVFLRSMGAVHLPIERLLLSDPAYCDAITDAPQRRRAGCTLSDLDALGAPPPADDARLPSIASLGAKLGVAYVFEGATLGGRVLSAKVLEHVPEGQAATAYVTGYGERTPIMWRRFIAALDATSLDERGHRDALDATKMTFALLTERAETELALAESER